MTKIDVSADAAGPERRQDAPGWPGKWLAPSVVGLILMIVLVGFPALLACVFLLAK